MQSLKYNEKKFDGQNEFNSTITKALVTNQFRKTKTAFFYFENTIRNKI